jgi:transposase
VGAGRFLHSLRDDDGCGGLEAYSLTAWLHAGLTEAGLPAICFEARQTRAATGAMPNKTDRNDARGARIDHAHRPSSRALCDNPDLAILTCAADHPAQDA